MINTLFKTNVYIKDQDYDDQWNNEVKSIVKATISKHVSESNVSLERAFEDGVPLFTDSNRQTYPQLEELFQAFVDGFYDLNKSYENEETDLLTREEIVYALSKEMGKAPLMKYGDFKKVHTHKRTSAYGIFYLDTVDNKKDGGILSLYDPSFNNPDYFHGSMVAKVPTVKHRMVVAPATVWHDVSPYFGDERNTIVINFHGMFVDTLRGAEEFRDETYEVFKD